MRERLTFDCLAGVFAVVLSVVAIGLGLSEDHLFFQSDIVSLARFMVLVSWCVGLALALALLTGVFVARRRITDRMPHAVAAIAFGVVVFGFLIFLIDSTTTVWRLRDLLLISIALLPSAIVCAHAGWTNRLSLDSFRLVLRAIFALGCGLVLWDPAGRLVRRLASVDDRPPPVNTILVVVDSLGPDDLSPWNTELSTPDFEAITSRSLCFDEARTNYAYTLGFFGIFYAGSKSGDSSRTSLLHLLHERGVNSRWITFHNNGIPRGRANHIGLSGSFLTQHTAPPLRALGLPHNIFWYWRPAFRGRAMSARESRLTHALNSGRPQRSLFGEVVPDEIESLRQDRRDFFLLVHTDTSALTGTAAPIWESGAPPQTHEERVHEEIRRLEHRYLARHEPFLADLRRSRDSQVRIGLRELRAFFDEFHRRGWARDTLLIVTADHGYLRYKRGRAWYIFHPDEEVSRVPLLLAGLGLQGRDTRLRQTVDLPQTILERHGVPTRLSPDAVSVLREPPAERVVTTMTGASLERQEQFLSVYQGHQKYVINLYGDRRVRKFEVDGFDLLEVAEDGHDALPFDLDAILDDYRWTPDPLQTPWREKTAGENPLALPLQPNGR